MKKKFLALALTAVMALSLAACGGDTQSTDTDADTSGDCCFANKLRKFFKQSAKKKRRLKGF